MKHKLILALLVGSGMIFGLQACKDDGDNGSKNTSTGLLTDSDKAKLYDKVWYSTSSSGGVDHEFLKDGTLRLSQSLEGRWNWINNGDTMDILNPSNQRYRYLIKTITANSISLTTSVDKYTTLHTYKDTE